MALNPKAEYEIHSKDRSKEGILSAQQNFKNFSSNISSAFKNIGKVMLGASATLTGVGLAINKLTDVYGVQEKAEIKLAAAAKNNPLFKADNARNLKSYASALQNISTYGDEVLISFMSLGVGMGHSEETIKKVSDAAINLAAATGMSLDSAFKNLYKTFGGMTGELGESIPALKTLTTEQLKNGEAVDFISKKYAGMAAAVRSSTAGTKEALANTFGDMTETIGSAFAPLQKELYNRLTPVFNSIGQWFTENSTAITNFFLNFGEIARLTFLHVKKSIALAFTWEHIANSFSALWTFLKETTVNAMKYLFQVITSIGITVWEPLKAGFDWVIYGVRLAWQVMINAFATGINWLVEKPVNAVAIAFKTVVNTIGNSIEWIINGIINMINVVIESLNKVSEGAHDAFQQLKHPFDSSKREKWSGGITKVNPLKIDWLDPKKHEQLTTNLDKFVTDLKEVPKPKNNWEEIYNTIKGTWVDTAIQGKEMFSNLFTNIGDLADELSVPFKLGFDGFTTKFFTILARDLPDALKPQAEKILDSMTEEGKIVQNWESFSFLIKAAWERLKTQFNKLVDTIKDTPKVIKTAFDTSAEFVKLAFTQPKEAIAKAGFAILNAFQKNAEQTEEGGKKLRAALATVGIGITNIFGSLFRFITDGIKDTQGFKYIMDTLSESFKILFEKFISPIVVAAGPLIVAITNVVAVLLNALEPAIQVVVNIVHALLPILKAFEPIFKEIGNLFQALLPIIQSLVQSLAMILIPVFKVLSDIIATLVNIIVILEPVISALFNALATILVPIVEFVGQIFTALAPLLETVAQALAMLAPVITVIGELVASILAPVLTFIADLFSAVLNPVLTVFAGIIQVLTPIFNIISIILKALVPVFSVLLSLLSILLIPLQLFGIIVEGLNPIFMLLAGIIEFITPVFEILAKVIDAATRPIEFLGNLLSWLGQGLKALGQTIWYLITFQWNKMGQIEWPGAFHSEAFTRPLIDTTLTQPAVNVNLESLVLPTPGSVNDTYTSAGASYGTNSLTINVTVNTEVIAGPDGTRELAKLIDNEISKLRGQGLAAAF